MVTLLKNSQHPHNLSCISVIDSLASFRAELLKDFFLKKIVEAESSHSFTCAQDRAYFC